ncbi:hypothetical protein Gp_6 [Bacillus phage vB_Bacillus_1020A]|uniref:hypothetical protein n=1 Tax=Robertmurraya sp. DFI.2.37 TaxID=3031819 RepID=UPI001248F23F|nr:hypothetical protein [Robertmurraya sp. DFI.2.37]MDF1511448.1 hypothetical protein [Robertmurraya sp. DFI.2.37]QIW89280.1 hypothetical protein Gp_6 [Bacillus phage vB_Bacillus_1020A]
MRFVGIDPSTKTGFVALDEDGQVLVAKELTGVGKEDPKRMATLIDEVMRHVQKDDFNVIEGFGYSSQQAIQMGGIGWGIRMALLRRKINYYDVAPNAVKKFVGVTGWQGEEGKKVRLKDKEKKIAVMEAVQDIYGFYYNSDNVVDAYIMARIALNLYLAQQTGAVLAPKHQLEVIDNILIPKKKAKPKRRVKSK